MRLLLLSLLILTGIAACVAPLPPQDVADRFWRAVVTRHPDKIKRYVRAVDQSALADAADNLPVSRYELGKIVIEDARATVDTRLTLEGPDALEVPVTTVLVREDDQWRVDYQATVAAISGSSELARVMRQLEQLGETLKHGIDRSVGDLKNLLPQVEEEIARFENEFKQRLPELREEVEEFRRRLEEALKEQPAAPAPPDGQIEI